MRNLSLTIPPVIILLLFALIMWGICLIAPGFSIEREIRWSVAGAVALTGLLLSLAGVVQFRKAKTTVHPMVPAETSAIVSSGVYSYTRNPMYLGMFLVLIGWGFYLMNPFSIIFSFGFIGYMNRFQIFPEEQILESKFGEEYRQYKQTAARWFV